jgi:hypothetical protein
MLRCARAFLSLLFPLVSVFPFPFSLTPVSIPITRLTLSTVLEQKRETAMEKGERRWRDWRERGEEREEKGIS